MDLLILLKTETLFAGKTLSFFWPVPLRVGFRISLELGHCGIFKTCLPTLEKIETNMDTVTKNHELLAERSKCQRCPNPNPNYIPAKRRYRHRPPQNNGRDIITPPASSLYLLTQQRTDGGVKVQLRFRRVSARRLLNKYLLHRNPTIVLNTPSSTNPKTLDAKLAKSPSSCSRSG